MCARQSCCRFVRTRIPRFARWRWIDWRDSVKATELEEVLPHMVIPGLPHAGKCVGSAVEDGTTRNGADHANLGQCESPVGAVMWACLAADANAAVDIPLRATLEHPHPLARLQRCAVWMNLGETDVTLFERRLEDDDAEVQAGGGAAYAGDASKTPTGTLSARNCLDRMRVR